MHGLDPNPHVTLVEVSQSEVDSPELDSQSPPSGLQVELEQGVF